MIAADASANSPLSLATIEAPAKPAAARRRAKVEKPAVVVQREKGVHDVTPNSARRYTRRWTSVSATTDVTISTEEGVHYCRDKKTGQRCDWCESHADTPDGGHAEIARDELYLNIHFAREEISSEASVDVFLAITDGLIAVRDQMVADGALVLSPRATLDAELASILNRPLNHSEGGGVAVCDCARCVAMRAEEFLCLACGYDGVPVVPGCGCPEGYDHAERHLAGDGNCNTGHGNWRACPVCELASDTMAAASDPARESFSGDDGSAHAATIIRDLRSALRSRGPA